MAIGHHTGQETHFDFIVLGIGTMGSSTCYHLARTGYRVLGLEQFDIPHEMGSHTGQSRIIRKAYFEHPDYIPLLEKAFQNWNHLETEVGSHVYFETGLLYLAPPDHPIIHGVQKAARQHHIRVEELRPQSMAGACPHLAIPDTYLSLYEPYAGFLLSEKAIQLYARLATKLGAVIHTRTKVTGWRKTNTRIELSTSTGNFTCHKLIITAGPWAKKVIPELSGLLTVTRQMVAWAIPKKSSSFLLGNFPCWMMADDTQPGIFYGFPQLPEDSFGGPAGFKLAHHYPGSTTDPDALNRDALEKDTTNLLTVLHKIFPEQIRAIHALKACMYTNTPDEHFIIDFLPRHDRNVIFATGFSGHGFKFASVVGEILCDLAVQGETDLPVDFLKLNRFSM